jgi:hypothetical protein
MAKTVETYINRATEQFEAGFTSKAAQKRALEDVNRAFELARKSIQDWCLGKMHDHYQASGERGLPEVDALYYGLPMYPHEWRVKHAEMVRALHPEADEAIALFDQIVDLRNAIKNTEIVKIERKANEQIERVYKSVREIMELRKSQYAHGLKLHDLFGGLHITANVHSVVNEHGTQFLRAFYYMSGVLTPLQIIIAVMQAKADENK